LHVAIGEFALALQDFREAMRVRPMGWRGLANTADLLASSPDTTPEDCRKALEYASDACDHTGSDNPWCLQALATASARLGATDKAAALQKKALALENYPKDRVAQGSARLACYLRRQPYLRERPKQAANPPRER
jgi:tetratricopeptide (TPR) repeat protein